MQFRGWVGCYMNALKQVQFYCDRVTMAMRIHTNEACSVTGQKSVTWRLYGEERAIWRTIPFTSHLQVEMITSGCKCEPSPRTN